MRFPENPTKRPRSLRDPDGARLVRILLESSVALIVFAGSWAGSIANAQAQDSAPIKISVSAVSCAKDWRGTSSGQREFSVTNLSPELFSIELVGADKASVYAEIETLAPRTTVPVEAVIGPGTYYWKCTTSLGSVQYSGPARVRGAEVEDAKANLPVTYAELASATEAYRIQVQAGLNQLASDTDALTAAVISADRSRSQELWLVAHLDYARLGAAYGTFGDFDSEINGRPNGLPQGVNDPNFEGFLRLEYGLWNGQPMPALVGVADRLDQDVHQLAQSFPSEPTPPTDVPLRTHEILENTLQFELTGETDEGSHTNLATAWANTLGTETTLNAIAPLLEERDPRLLSNARSGLTELTAELVHYRNLNGSWVPLQDLSEGQREELDGSVSSLLEKLSLIPDILEISPNAADKT